MSNPHCYIILLESATDSCSVALSDGESLVDEKYISTPKIHDKIMAALVEEILKENSLTVRECAAVAVSSGPGSYMGLRIAASLGKGLAFGAGIPLVSVGTTEALAQSAIDSNLVHNGITKIVPMIDAGRMEVYTATYSVAMEELSPVAAKILDQESFAEELSKEKILFIGNGAPKFETLSRDKSNAFFAMQLPKASGLRVKAAQAVKNSKYESVAYFEPFYLKDFIPGKPKKLL